MASQILIGNKDLFVRDTYCVETGDNFSPIPGLEYIRKERPRLWLYVHITDRCNAVCPFCVNGGNDKNSSCVDPAKFAEALEFVKPYIYGISFTGGEPMLYPELLNELVAAADRIVSSDIEIDTTTNGTNFHKLIELKQFRRITSVHISRHLVDKEQNDRLMGLSGISDDILKTVLKGINDPGKLVFNCVLQKGGVESFEDIAEYLDHSIQLGILNNSFISMFKTNGYCEDNYVSAYDFPVMSDTACDNWNLKHPEASFKVWNRHSDHSYCHCLSGSYRNRLGSTRFYFRCPGDKRPQELCRQLIYTSDNRLQDGFGKDCKVLWPSIN